jgi:hypothetical protein
VVDVRVGERGVDIGVARSVGRSIEVAWEGMVDGVERNVGRRYRGVVW